MNLNEMIILCVMGMGVVMVTLAGIMLVVVIISKIVGSNNKTPGSPVRSQTPSYSTSAPLLNIAAVSDGLNLTGTDEKTAAMIMAIISDQTGIPLSRLIFKSIKYLNELKLVDTDDKTAAMIMAIISHNTGIPLSRLNFKSIKLIKE